MIDATVIPSMPYRQDGGDPYRQRTPDPWERAQPAGFGVRFAARAADSVALLIGGLFVGAFAGMAGAVLNLLGLVGKDWVARVSHTGVSNFAFSMVGTVIYYAVAESMGGATLGKYIFGLRVAREDLSRASFGAALVRNLAFFVDGMFAGLVGYSAMSGSLRMQRYGDRWAKTVVVRVEGAPASVVGTAGALAVGIFAGWLCDAACNFAAEMLRLV